MNESMNDKADCRIALATPGLLNMAMKIIQMEKELKEVKEIQSKKRSSKDSVEKDTVLDLTEYNKHESSKALKDSEIIIDNTEQKEDENDTVNSSAEERTGDKENT